MGVLDTIEPMPDVMNAGVKPNPAGNVDDAHPGALDTIGASFRAGSDAIHYVQDKRLEREYAQLAVAVAEKTGKSRWSYIRPGTLLNPFAATDFDTDAIWQDVNAYRRTDANAFNGIEANRAAFERRVVTRDGLSDQDAALAAKGGWLPRTVGGFAAGLRDPVNVGVGVATGAGSAEYGLAKGMLTEALINAGIETGQTPFNIQAQHRLGHEVSALDVAENIGGAFVFGGALHAVGQGVGYGYRSTIDAAMPGYRAYREVQRMQLGGATGGDLARAFRAAVPEHYWTPDEQAAVNVATREAEIDDTSPYEDTHAGQAKHRERLAEGGQRIADAAMPPETPAGQSDEGRPERYTIGKPPERPIGPGTLHPQIVAFFRARGYSDAQARGIAAGIHAESQSDPNARGPLQPHGEYGALGLGQWLGARRKAVIAKYGENPTLMQQLDFLDHELRGGDPGGAKVLAAGDDEAAVMRAYITNFMRPAVGPQLDRDLARGMVALGHGKGEPFVPPGEVKLPEGASPASDIDSAMADALAAERADVEAQRNRLDAEPVSTAPEGPRQGELNFDLPNLRRDLFPDDASHRLAQAEADADALGLKEPVFTAKDLEREKPVGHALSEEERQAVRDTELEVLRQRDRYLEPSNTAAPTTDFPKLPVGSAKIGAYGEPGQAYVQVLREFDPNDLIPTEHADNIRQSQTYQDYLRWAQEGHEAPPVFVAESDKGDGKLFTTNRRRVLAAQEAGVTKMLGWFSPHNPETGLPLKYGDVMAEREALFGAGQEGAPPTMAAGVDTPEGLWAAQKARGFPADPVFGVVGKHGEVTAWEPTYEAASRRAGEEGGSVRELAPADFGVPSDPRMNDHAAELFDDPTGEAAKAQAADLSHTVKTALDDGLFEGINFSTLAAGFSEHASATLARLDGDDAALAAIKGCL